MFKKAKLYSLLAIIVVSTVVGLFGARHTASAQEGGDQNNLDGFRSSEVAKEAAANVYASVLSYCMTEHSSYGPSNGMKFSDWQKERSTDAHFAAPHADTVQNGVWFGENTKTTSAVGYMVDGEDGVLSCSEITYSRIRSTLDSEPTPYNNPLAFACYLGFVAATVSPLNSRGETTNDSSFTLSSTYDECVGAASDPTAHFYVGANGNEARAKLAAFRTPLLETSPEIDPVQDYILYKDALDQCGTPLSFVDLTSPGSETPYLATIVVDRTGQKRDVYYRINDPNTTKPVGPGDGRGGSGGLSCSSILAGVNNSVNAHSDWLAKNQDKVGEDTNVDAKGDDTSTSTCRIDGIGWIICPLMNFLAGVVDDSYTILDNSLLRTAPLQIGDDEDPLFKSWKVVRDFANVVFVGAFLVIVFSQITSIGVSNYGIKRLLPKLVVAAIMVNLSYYACAIAVDISNVLGASLRNLLDTTIGDRVSPSQPATRWDGGDSGPVGWKGITGLALAGTIMAGGPFALIAFLIPILFMAITAVLATVVTLIIRQVLIILLIIVSPLAFVALLLPNTESYFKKWRVTFQALLLLYPIIAIVFGASALASKIITNAAENYDDTAKVLIQVTGAAAAVLPLLVTPALMRLGGGVLNRFAGIVNDPNKGLIDRSRNAAMKKAEAGQKMYATKALDTNRKKWQYMPGARKIKKGVDRRDRERQLDKNVAYAEATYSAAETLNEDVSLVQKGVGRIKGKNDEGNYDYKTKGDQRVDRIARGGGDQARTSVRAGAVATLGNLEDAEVEATVKLIKASGPPHQELDRAREALVTANGAGDVVNARAAAKILSNGGGAGNRILDEVIQKMEEDNEDNENVFNNLRADLKGSKGSNSARDKWATEGGKLKHKYSPIELQDDGKPKLDKNNKQISNNVVSRLNEQELAGQQMHVLREAKTLISPQVAQRVLEQHAIGAITLDDDKIQLFQEISPPPPAQPVQINITRSAVDPATGAVNQQALDGSAVAQQIHNASGSTTPMSRQSLRAGLGKVTDEHLGEIIATASANAATDTQYQGILDIARKEASGRNRSP